MKRYIGDYMMAYVGIAGMVLIIISIAFGIGILINHISIGSVLFSCYCFCISIGFCAYMIKYAWHCFAWCEIDENGITVKSIFKKPFTLAYDKCRTIGIGYYIHGVLNSKAGTKHYYFYFSKTYVEDTYQNHINLAKISPSFVKIGYNKKLYQYMIKHLPKSQAAILMNDVQKFQI